MPVRSDVNSSRRTRIASQVMYCLAFLLSLPAFGEGAEDFFESKIRPVLVESCFECHSAEAKRLGGQLRLDTREGILEGGDLGPAAVIGKPDQSLLIQAMEHREDDLMMPKRKAKLSSSTIDGFKQWIRDGLFWPASVSVDSAQEAKSRGFDLSHRKARLPWIWERPKPQGIPSVEDTSWPEKPIDYFILAELEKKGMSPNGAAEPAIWLRRVSQALTGLPPTEQLLASFLELPTSRRYAFAVDALLSSPRFGERWARHWMDLVRYAESRGHESDFVIANAYHYRDYLIRAFNADLPYNQFVREHLAGDLLAAPRPSDSGFGNESILGTAWPFLGEEVHSPVDIRQDECDRIDNKVDVMSKAFLGLTVACARCHDHKFDAISQRDYYGMAGFFLSSNFQQVRFESQLSNRAVARQLEAVRKESQPKLWKAFIDSVNINEDLDLSSGTATQQRDEKEFREVVTFSNTGLRGGQLTGPAMRFVPRATWYASANESSERLDISPRHAVMRDPLWKGLRMKRGNQQDAGSLDATSRSGGMLKTHRFQLKSGKLHYLIKGKTKVYAAVDNHIMVIGPLHGALVKVFESKDSNTPVWVTHDLSEYQGHLVHLEFGLVGNSELEIFKVIESEEPPSAFSPNGEPISAFEKTADVKELMESIKRVEFQVDQLSDQEQSAAVKLTNALKGRGHSFGRSFTQQSRQLQEAENELMKGARLESLTAVALSENNGVNESILIRGNPKRPGKPAPRGLLSAFGYSPEIGSEGSGRLELSEAILDPRNPLTSRVFVNRVWHHLFGRGIVSTVDNFGFLGERPSHPELLDYLAFEFVNTDKWSLKQLIRKIVLSKTYRMSSEQRSDSQALSDPKNILLSRFPIRRLEAEAIRDNMLAISGGINPVMFGTSVPVHLTDFVVGRGRPEQSGPLDGKGRRSIYIATRRNFLPTLMTAFDFPTPFSTIGRRNVTNVPAQSLALSNDEFVHLQALTWARQLLATATPSVEGKIEIAFRAAFSRMPTPTEKRLCLEALNRFETIHQSGELELDSWRDLCHALLVKNEFVYIR